MTYFQILSFDLKQLFYSQFAEPVQWILSNLDEFKNCKPITSNKKVCKYIASCKMSIDPKTNIELMKWSRTKECPWNEKVICEAARCGNLELVQWCYYNGCPVYCSIYDSVYNGIMLSAASGGHIKIIQWVSKLSYEDKYHLHYYFEWHHFLPSSLIKNKKDTDQEIINKLKWCQEEGYPLNLDTQIKMSSGISGRMNVIKWLNDQNIFMDEYTCSRSSQSRTFRFIKMATR